MKLLAIELQDFRQYMGINRVTFAVGADRNVTVFYGPNGAGKSTLLHALTWTLYGDKGLTDDFEEQHRLINDTTWQEAAYGMTVTASVTVEFEHEGAIYTARREAQGLKNGAEQRLSTSKLNLRRRSADGVTKEVGNEVESPGSAINRILDLALSKFFFVNGERIEHMVRADAYVGIQSAIKTLLGIEQLERAEKHIPQTKNQLHAQMKTLAGRDAELAAVMAEIKAKTDEQIGRQERLAALEAEITATDSLIREDEALLKELDESRILATKRSGLERASEDIAQRLTQEREARTRHAGVHGYLLLLDGLPGLVSDLFGELRTRGDIPAPIKAQLINDLVEKERCICGTNLTTNAAALQVLRSWQGRAGLADAEEAWYSLNTSVVAIPATAESARSTLTSLDAAIAESEAKLRSLTHEIAEITLEIKNLGHEDVAKIEQRRDKNLERKNGLLREQGSAEGRIKVLAAALAGLEQKRAGLTARGRENEVVEQRVAVANEVLEALGKLKHLMSEATRQRLETGIRTVFESVSLKNFQPDLNKDYHLELWQKVKDGRVHAPKSTGENMLLALSFVAALANECRTVEEKRRAGTASSVLQAGGEFPVVMDAAFGNLDNDYRRRIADFLPRLTPQVIVFTSMAQAEGAVEETLSDRVGQRYVITTFTEKSELPQGATPTVEFDGRDYPYQVAGAQRSYSTFTEVVA